MSSLVSSLTEILPVRRVESSACADALFRKRFGQPVPDYPHHYVATYKPAADRVVGYVHMTGVDEMRLCGGLCVDEMAYRTMKREHFAAIRDAGGVAKLLLMASCLDGLEARATFAYTGNKRSRELIEQLGFACVAPPYLFALWHSQILSRREKTDTLEAAKALGPF